MKKEKLKNSHWEFEANKSDRKFTLFCWRGKEFIKNLTAKPVTLHMHRNNNKVHNLHYKFEALAEFF